MLRPDSRVTIPVVCLVLNGGPGTLNVSQQSASSFSIIAWSQSWPPFASPQTIYNAMLNGTPCVVFEGSGRIADVIGHVSGFPVSLVTIALIHQLMKKCFGQEYETFSEIKILEWTKKVCQNLMNQFICMKSWDFHPNVWQQPKILDFWWRVPLLMGHPLKFCSCFVTIFVSFQILQQNITSCCCTENSVLWLLIVTCHTT